MLDSNHSFQPSFLPRTGRFPWVSGGFLERRIPGKNGNGRYPQNSVFLGGAPCGVGGKKPPFFGALDFGTRPCMAPLMTPFGFFGRPSFWCSGVKGNLKESWVFGSPVILRDKPIHPWRRLESRSGPPLWGGDFSTCQTSFGARRSADPSRAMGRRPS